MLDVRFDQLVRRMKSRLALALGQRDERGSARGMVTTPRILGLVPDLSLRLWRSSKREAERLVQHARERMRGVDGDGSEQRVDLLLKEFDGELAIGLAELLPAAGWSMPARLSAGTRRSFQQVA